MKLIHVARVSIAFLIVAITLSLTGAILAGGGFGSGRSTNNDPRTVTLQFALLSSPRQGSSAPAIDALRAQFTPGAADAKQVDAEAFTQALNQARTLAGPGEVWIAPGLAAQHEETANLTLRAPASAERDDTLVLAVSPRVLDKDVIRTAIDFSLCRRDQSASLEWSTALTFRDGAVIAVDLDAPDPETGEPRSMVLIARASIVTNKPS